MCRERSTRTNLTQLFPEIDAWFDLHQSGGVILERQTVIWHKAHSSSRAGLGRRLAIFSRNRIGVLQFGHGPRR
jgi:hypothetical protein